MKILFMTATFSSSLSAGIDRKIISCIIKWTDGGVCVSTVIVVENETHFQKNNGHFQFKFDSCKCLITDGAKHKRDEKLQQSDIQIAHSLLSSHRDDNRSETKSEK
jgi:hypothetical protein